MTSGLSVVCTSLMVLGRGESASAVVYKVMVIIVATVVGAVVNATVESGTDALMMRTHNRGIKTVGSFGWFACVGCIVAAVALAAAVSDRLTTLAVAAGLVLYGVVYARLKPLTFMATVIGAVAGAVPVFVGAVDGTGCVGWLGASVAAYLVAWQFPHFLAISSKNSTDYERASLRMSPRCSRRSVKYFVVMVIWCCLSVCVLSLGLTYASFGSGYELLVGLAGVVYMVLSGVAGRGCVLASRSLFGWSVVYAAAVLVYGAFVAIVPL